MAKLTLSFKDRKLKVFALQAEDCVIGRKADCSIAIDSLAVEPRHARIRPADEGFVIEPVAPDGQVLVNGQPISEACELHEGDQIQIGKHTLSYSGESGATVAEFSPRRHSSVGWMQIQSGSHLGRTIRLDKAFTRIGRPDGELAVIAHRDDGYYLSQLQGTQKPLLNDQAIGEDSYKLKNKDEIRVGELRVQFFSDAEAAQDSELPVTEQNEEQQRHFSRIPFDVPVSLRSEQQAWESVLVDISLHGALIKTPADFTPDAQHTYQLAVHLVGGPDICMDVLIAHQEKDELGLRCKDIDVDSITHLRRLVELNLGDPQLLEREISALG